MRNIDPLDIDAVLPQTQCGLCGHGGCMPYAEAIAFAGEALDLCPPGGVETLTKLGDLLNENVSALIEGMQEKAKPQAIAKIIEDECIGCTKCIQVCPVDAIIGAAKHIHTVITDQCNGCELCIPACPVDCIDMFITSHEPITEATSTRYRQRFHQHEARLLLEKKQMLEKKRVISHEQKAAYIQAALSRTKKS